MNDILKKCDKCENKFVISEYNLLPVEDYYDYGYDENNLDFIYKCPHCGNINSLTITEQNELPIEIIRLLMERYAHCSNNTLRVWKIENEIKELVKQLITLEEEKVRLNDKIKYAIYNTNKDCLYHHWPTTENVIDNISQKRKKLKKY